jgi:hypothetical protein
MRKVERGNRRNWKWRLATPTSSGSTVARVRVVTTLQALLVADARRDARRTGRIGARWKTTVTTTMTTTMAEVS